MRAGLAGPVAGNTSLAEDLAGHGYVVVGFDAPYRSSVVVFPDGQVIPRAPQNNLDLIRGPEQEKLATKLVEAWSADTSFALDQLERLNAFDASGRFLGRLDLQRVGIGHSLGGATALQFCHDDSRCKAGIDVDGAPIGSVVQLGVIEPFMFILSARGRVGIWMRKDGGLSIISPPSSIVCIVTVGCGSPSTAGVISDLATTEHCSRVHYS